MAQKSVLALHHVHGILWKPEGAESRGGRHAAEATPDDPLVLLLRTFQTDRHPFNDGDLPGGGVFLGRENGEQGLARHIHDQTGLPAEKVGEPHLVWGTVADEQLVGEPINVVHETYVAQVALDAQVSREPFERFTPEHRSAEWVLMSRAIGEMTLPVLRDSLQWVYERGLWQMAEPPAA